MMLALKSLRRRGIRSWLTMLGIIIGIAAVISLISLGDGLREAITGEFSDLGNDKLVVENIGAGFGPPGSTAPERLSSRDLRIIEDTPGVKIAIPRLIRLASVISDDERKFSYIASIPEDKASADVIFETVGVDVAEGKFIDAGQRGSVILGQDIRKGTFDKDLRLGESIEIQGKNFKIAGILEKTSSFQINGAILMAEADIEEILNIDDEIDIILVQVSDENKIIDTADAIERRMRKDRNEKKGEEDFSVKTPLQSFDAVNTVLMIIQVIFFGIASISLIIGGIGIANTMYTSVLERTKEIGVMKAIGARNHDILLIFIIESALLGLVGGIIGVAFGIALAFGITYIVGLFLGSLMLKAQISFLVIILTLSFAIGVGIAAGVLPAFQASRLKPVEALRK